CKSIEIAIEGGFDYVCIYETDFLMTRAIRPLIERMHKAGVKASSPGLAAPYQFPEWAVMLLNVQYAKDAKIIEKYDWEHSPPLPLVEMRWESIYGDDYWPLNLRGMRNDVNQLNVGNLANMFPYGVCQWLTHCQDPNLYYRMLQLNNIHLI